MNCPRHHTGLKPHASNNHYVNQCPDCAGVWIQGTSIDHILGKGEALKLRSLCSVRTSDLLCPMDGKRLYEGKVGPVTVDLCRLCNGLWLDPGELETLRARKPVTPHLRSESSVPLNDVDYSLPETVLWGLVLLADL